MKYNIVITQYLLEHFIRHKRDFVSLETHYDCDARI